MASEILQPVNAGVDGAVKDSKMDPPAVKTSEMKDVSSASDAASCISSVDAGSSTMEGEVKQEPVVSDQGVYYPVDGLYSYYYPEWNDQSYYVGATGSEIQPAAGQADNGSVVYCFPGFQPDYTPYNPYLPGTMINVDGQYLGQQLYYPNSMFSQPFVSPVHFPQSVAYGPELIPAYSWDSSPFYADGFYGNVNADSTYSAHNANFSSYSHTHTPSKTFPPSKFGSAETKGSSPTVDVSPYLATQNQPLKPLNKAASILSKGFHPVKKLPSYDNQAKGGLWYPYSTTNINESGRSWVGTDKVKARNKVHSSVDFDMLNEQNRGPRTNGSKSNLVSDSDGLLGTKGNADSGVSNLDARKDGYNLLDFPTKYDHALFFVIKSYSEDDIHKSIKYNVWASTPNGNKRLENAFYVAQGKMAEKGSKCPVFLFFSVNASGQFCGVAEMIGQVDFNKNMDFWQQDKWTGYFPVKWHIIKDVPNPQFRHIILENNENKPVTNSRDTQEVKFIQGTEMLNIFKSYSSKTSILDDFSFYENRQKTMQDNRIIPTPNLKHLVPKTDDMVHAEAIDPSDTSSIVSGLLSLELAEVDKKEQLANGDKWGRGEGVITI